MMAEPEYKRWYGLSIWRKTLRPGQLRLQPLCEFCEAQEIIAVATIVDHKIPHRGDWNLFKDPSNLQSLCKLHHDSTKQAQEASGLMRGHGASGIPLDPNHSWNRSPSSIK